MSDQVRRRTPETRYTEFAADAGTVALIADVTNERAWIQSDTTARVEP
jgi:hypothetical protein